MTTRPTTATGSITSRDGTTIGYRRMGHGPGLVLLHGMMSSGQHHIELAEALADAFTVYLPDRRGRGLSGPYTGEDGILEEVDDLAALLAVSEANRVVAVSAGAIVVLEALLSQRVIQKAALFEPPLFASDAVPRAILTRFDREMADGNIAAALVTAMKGAQEGPPVLRVLPRRLLEFLTGRFMASQDGTAANGYVPMRALVSTLHHDMQLVVEMSGSLDRLGSIRAEVLLLGASKSPAYLKAALDGLAKVLPKSGRVELPGLDHAATWNTDVGGRPEPVARELRRFLA
jgi:pimeloyl-ACP methyl ester carboxylesterase